MKKHIRTLAAVSAVVSAVLAGCSEQKAPPLERLDLVSRFFESIRNERFADAAQQGRKLYEMDPNNEFLLHLITIHESNAFLRQAQITLNSGKVDETLRILDEGIARYPENRTLRMYRTKVSQLRNAKSLIAAMKRAKGEAAMSAALTAAETGLGTNMSPKLEAYFKSYETRIKLAAQESEKETRRLEAEKERKRLEAEKAAVLQEPKVKLPPSRLAKPVIRRQEGTKPGVPESLDRPQPIVPPESENVQ